MGCHNHKHKNPKKDLITAMIVIGSIFLLELLGGIFTNSLALLGDAAHMFMDFFALFLTFFTIHLAERVPTEKRTFGYHRTEIFAALLNGVILLGVCVFILYEAIIRLLEPATVHGGGMLAVAVIGLLANVYVMKKIQHHTHSLNIKGAYLHVLSDTLSSLIVIIGAFVIYFTGFNTIDPILSLIIVGIISIGAFKLVIEALDILMESVPKDIDYSEVENTILSCKNITGVHALHIWAACSEIYLLSAHIETNARTIKETEKLTKDINSKLKLFNIKYTTLQFGCSICNTNKKKLKH